MSEFLAYLTVFVAAAIPWLEVLLVVPAGIVAGLAPGPTAVIAAAGNLATLIPLVVAGDRIRSWWGRRKAARDQSGADGEAVADGAVVAEAEAVADDALPRPGAGRDARARGLFERFGLPGLALLGPLLTGVHVAGLVALGAGARRRPTLLWLSGGVVVWAALAALGTLAGLETFVDADALPDWFAT